MNQTQTLTHHRDIQNWVSSRHGMPAISRIRDNMGELRARLTLSFNKSRRAPSTTPTQDDGMSPVSWTAWLAELDRQNLALKIIDQRQPVVELVERRNLN